MGTTEYQLIKNSNNDVLFKVEIETKAGTLITTSVYTIMNYEKKVRQKLSGSTDVNCNYKIGTSKDWDGALLVVKNVLNLQNINESQYETVFNNSKIKYFLSGGQKDEKFEQKETDVTIKTKKGKTIIFEKRFFLIS